MGNKKDISKQIKAFQLQAQDIMNDTAVPVDDRIQKTADIYLQAEKLAEESSLEESKYESLLSDSAKFFLEYGMYKEALTRYLHLIDLRESLYGQEQSSTASAYYKTGETYWYLCDYKASLENNQKALDIRLKVLGEKNRETADSYNDIGLTYYYLGDYDKAFELISKAMTIREEVVGLKHPDMAESYNNIGLIRWKLEDYSSALEYFLKSLNIYEETVGREHRKTALMSYCVGLIKYEQGNYAEALDYCSKAIAVYEKVLGKEHPDIITVLVAMGFINFSSCNISEAFDFFSKALEVSKKTVGENHLYTAGAYNALGYVKSCFGEGQEALECSEKSLYITEKVLGKKHPDTAESYHIMGAMYNQHGFHDKANECYSKALEIYESVSGTELINKKIKEVQADMENNNSEQQNATSIMVEKKGTRDLFLETLTKIGCQYELAEEEDDNHVYFAFQGENFIVNARNDWQYIHIWDMHWAHIELYDIDEFSRLKKVINSSNISNSVTAVYTIDEEAKTVDVHSRSVILFTPEIQGIEDYLKLELGDFFHVHRYVNLEMAKLRDQEQQIETIEN